MKQTLPLLVALTLASQAVAQCSVDSTFAQSGPGLYPQGPMSPDCDLLASKTVVGITDTTIANPLGGGDEVTVYLTGIRINAILGLPAGLTLETDVMDSADEEGQWGYWYNSGDVPEQSSAVGCGHIVGSSADWAAAAGGGPNSDGVYPLEFTIDAYVESTDNALLNQFLQPQWLSALGDLGPGAFVVFDTLVILPGFNTIAASIIGADNADAGSSYIYSTDAIGDTYDWTVTNGTIVSGQGTDSIEVVWDVTGQVAVNVINNACSGTDTLDVTVINTAMAEASRTRTVVYPNPSEGLFHVLLPDDGSVDVRILDMNGSVVRTERSSGRRSLQVDLRNTPTGMYILELRSATGVARECLVRN
ncbi:MAG TPA: T9SS type A sorting domain-containing protein [Flavobacteriales bacterium]|nr:T9SS type A sorting domain-containing protein [Flavobacteriales bacterium]